MLNNKKINTFWKKRATNIKDPRIAIHFKHDDMHFFDLKNIRKYTTDKTHLLDLGSGPCFFANELIDNVEYIKAVDKFGEFLKYCKNVPNLVTEECDLLNFKDLQIYDLILLIGTMHFFDVQDREKIYKKTYDLLKKNGVAYIRHQCGIETDIEIDKYSEQIGDNYHAKYLQLEKETCMLKELFKSVNVIAFPKRFNPWHNTRYYAFICKK